MNATNLISGVLLATVILGASACWLTGNWLLAVPLTGGACVLATNGFDFGNDE